MADGLAGVASPLEFAILRVQQLAAESEKRQTSKEDWLRVCQGVIDAIKAERK